MTRRDKSEIGKFAQQTADYARKTCVCGHSVLFKPSRPYMFCKCCGRRIINDTRGRFLYMIYKALRKESELNDSIKL
jgi:hypothetical protein